MKKTVFLILTMLISTPVICMFQKSPWIIIDNKTPFSLNCQIVMVYYYTDYEYKEIVVQEKMYNAMTVNWKQSTDDQGKNCILFFCNIRCLAHETITLESIFSTDNKIFYPLIDSASFTQESLQLTVLSNIIKGYDCYFSVEYEPYSGIIAKAEPISIYTKCMHSSQKIIEKTIAAVTYFYNYIQK